MNETHIGMLSDLPFAALVLASDGRIVSYNRAAVNAFGHRPGYPEIEWSDEAGNRVKLSDDRPPGARRILSTVRDGRVFWYMADIHPGGSDSGSGESTVFLTDVTALKTSEANLRDDNRRLDLVLKGSQDGFWDWNLLTGEYFYSDSWWRMLGREPEEIQVSPHQWHLHIHPEDRDCARRVFRESLAGLEDSYAIRFRVSHKAGHYVDMLARGFISRNTAGMPVRISGTNTDISHQVTAEERITHLAFHDELTLVANRRLILRHLESACAACAGTAGVGAAIYIDVNDFKRVNDTFGHATGDRFLKGFAEVLANCLSPGDLVGRLGGDEFLIVCNPSTEKIHRRTQTLLRKIRIETTDFTDRSDINRTIGWSAGVAVFNANTASPVSVLENADLAMLESKATQRPVHYFHSRMKKRLDDKKMLVADLQEGLRLNQFVPHYQPQVHEGRIFGVELLIRWMHPVHGMVPPSEFITLAEKTGLIVELGRQVVTAACKQIRAWESRDFFRDLTISVNISAIQFRAHDFESLLVKKLHKYGVPASKLTLELTESVFAEDIGLVVAKMKSLRSHGFRISLDDFGTGYSSLSYLMFLPLDELKIDKSFVQNMATSRTVEAVVRMIVSLARELDIGLLAEGVEDATQAEVLESLGCHCFQGYHFGRPQAVERFEATATEGMPT